MGRCSDAKVRLLQVAFDLIWQQSYGSVSVDDICDRAEVRKGSFYHFFPSKSDLATAAYEEHWQRCRPHYDAAFSPQIPPLERLHKFCDLIYEIQVSKFTEHGRVLGCPFGTLAAELSTQDEKIRQKAMEMFSRYCRYLESTLRDAHSEGLIEQQDFAERSQAIVCYVLGVMLQARVRNEPDVLRAIEPNILNLIGATQFSPR